MAAFDIRLGVLKTSMSATENSLLFARRQLGLDRLADFVNQGRAGQLYARERNFDKTEFRTTTDQSSLDSSSNVNTRGFDSTNVSHLSPYIRHRLILETEVLSATLKREDPLTAEKFIQEVCWRTYWKGWLERNPTVWQNYGHEREQLASLTPALQKAIRRAQQATTGIECFDHWVEQLVQTGYLHNHARMWFASIWIFTLNLPWVAGADFFMQHLSDADAAANTLSWRWVAGLHTKGKHYLARAENIMRYTDGQFNPRGQLNETAQALVEPDVRQRLASNEQSHDFDAEFWRSNWLKAASESFQSNVNSPNSLLLIHDEDLNPESFDALAGSESQILGLIVVNSASRRSTQGVGELSSNFVSKALTDAKARAQHCWGLKPEQVIECQEPNALAHLLEGRLGFDRLPIITPWMPVGPTRDALSPEFRKLTRRGIDIKLLARPWDVAAWPHASKGFFQFKTKIPDLLRTAL